MTERASAEKRAFFKRQKDKTEYAPLCNPHKLGFMRFIEFRYIAIIMFTMLALIFMSKDEYPLGAQGYAYFISLILKSIALWMIVNRKKALLVFLPASCAAEIAFDFVFLTVMSGVSLLDLLLMELGRIVIIVYTITSRRMKNIMVQPFSKEENLRRVEDDANRWNPRSITFWRNLLIYFCIFSVVGHWMEAGYCTLIRFGIMPGTYDPNSQIWSDWLYPFMVYGIGFCVCGLLLFPIKVALERKFEGILRPFVFSFLANALVCAGIELTLGLTQNADLQLWDYSDMFMNFMGQICLVNSLMFGAVATLMTWLVYPLCERLLGDLTREGGTVVFIAVIVFYALLMCLYYINGNSADFMALFGMPGSGF